MTAKLWRACAGLALIVGAHAATASTITITTPNGAGLGTSDTTPATPVGGNPGDTVGAQRLYVFQKAAEQWGKILNSNVTIRVTAQMTSLTCSGTSAVLGSAGPNNSFTNFANAPRTNTWYVQAEANALAGSDLGASIDDISANFNVDIDDGTCLTGTTGWWYGTDPDAVVPTDKIPMLPVVFHELGHGLGFLSLTNSVTGAFCCGGTLHPDAWAYYQRDAATSLLWSTMTPLQRKASAINDPNLTWVGPNVNRVQKAYLGPAVQVTINSPPAVAGVVPAQTASFGPSVPSAGITATVVPVTDGVVGGTGGTVNDGCEAFTNAPGSLTGKIALIERGLCNFSDKAQRAQDAGAIAVLIFNNAATGLPPMGGASDTLTIPSLGISQAAGNSIRNASGVSVTLGYGTDLSGTQGGCVRLFAPNPLQSGSSVSHFSSDAHPDLLMEPALNETIFDKVDLTVELFKDIGWSTNKEDLLFFDEFDPNRCAAVQP